ncbi:hypothetical protein [Shewanella sp. UCD-KL12]|uniref:hypothetical protein n=1 Tax=Shewanella sp. UCD-KL12 TaxID=1917163 RepID=UPI00097115F7|nr:hypothetical protein [Shewanella sp. UCD-KL12]
MYIYLRLGLLLLFIGGMFLSPVSASLADNLSVNLNEQVSAVEQVHLDSSASPSSTKLLQLKQLPGHNHAHGQDGDSSEYVPLVSQRLVNFAQHDPISSKPVYLLAHEFFSPPVPSLTIGYRIDFACSLDWALQLNKNSIRLSGWKDSNLQYRFSQTRSA